MPAESLTLPDDSMPEGALTVCHEAFIGAIARSNPRSEAWRVVAAGLIVMRLLEDWTDGEPVDSSRIQAVAHVVSSLSDDTSCRESLSRLILTMQEMNGRDFGMVAPVLFEYARALEFDAIWHLAVDVYNTVIRRLGTSRSTVIVQCYVRLGFCYRNLNMLSLAAAAFERGRSLAVRRRDTAGELRAVLGQARLVMLRGNVPAAETMLQRVLKRAHGAALEDVRSRALHDSSNFALRRGEYVRAVKLAFEALTICREDSEKPRILSDVALAFLQMGNYETARDAYVVVASSAKEQWVRWVACLNLIDVESKAGDRDAFDRYVLLLRGEKLTAELRMLYQLNIGEGLLRFGELLRAREHLKLALAMASDYGLNETVIEAERLLASTDDPQPSLRQEPLQNELIRIATVLRGMRAAVSG